MSIRKRTWETNKGETREVWIVDYTDQTGVRRLKTFNRKKEADAFAAKTHVQIREGTHVPDSASITVKEAGQLWLRNCRAADLEQSTLDQYEQHLRLHIVPFIGRQKLSQLNVPFVLAYRAQLTNGDKQLDDDDPRKLPRSQAMVRGVIGSLGALIAEAQDSGLVAYNAVHSVSKSKRRRKQPAQQGRHKRNLEVGVDIPAPDEVRTILATARGRWRPFLLTAVFTGLRASELRGLR